MGAMGVTVKQAQDNKRAEIIKLGGITEECLHALKLVVSFANEHLALKRFDAAAKKSQEVSLKAAKATGCVFGMFMTCMFGYNCWAYFIARLIVKYNWINPATGIKFNIVDIMVCSQATQMSIMTLGTLLPIIPGIIKGLLAGYSIMEVIERVPDIRDQNDSVSARGNETDKIESI